MADDPATEISRLLPRACLEGRTLWIAGEWQASSSGGHFVTLSPIDGRPLARVAAGQAEDIDRAVESAHEALPRWAAQGGGGRATVLRRIAATIRENGDRLGLIETLDSGRPIAETAGRSIDHAAGLFDYYAGLADKLHGTIVPMGEARSALVEREPLGVVGAISPWNYPLLNAATKIAPILACGNVVVLKPAEQTPLVTLLLAELMQQAGLPDGAVNIVTGTGREAGAPLVEHPDVAKISFTGSTATGREIAASAGRRLKGVVLELGGKSPLIVFDDADIDRAAQAAVFSAFMNQGQTCTSCSRVLLAETVSAAFLARCRGALSRLSIGDPRDPRTQVGAIVSEQQLQRVASIVADHRGIDLDLPGYRPSEGGFFFRPMIVTQVAASSELVRDEIFGPVMTVATFALDEEAYSAANRTEYGLAASVWTKSLSRAEAARRRLQSGIVWINCVHDLSPGTPVSGHKQSGLGSEYGLEAMDQYMKIKTSVVMTDRWGSPFAG